MRQLMKLSFAGVFALIALSISPGALADTSHPIQIASWQVDIASKLINAILAIGGATWAYYKFAKFRTFKNRVEFTYQWSESKLESCSLLAIVTIKLANKGSTKISLFDPNNGPICGLRYQLLYPKISLDPAVLLNCRPRDLLSLGDIFSQLHWIEPGETIDDVRVLTISDRTAVAIQMEVRVFGNARWSAPAAFALTDKPTSETATTEDEQAPYTDAERLQSLLEDRIASATRVLKESVIRIDGNVLMSFVQQAESFLSDMTDHPDKETIAKGDELARNMWILIESA